MRIYVDLDSEFVLGQPVSYPAQGIAELALKRAPSCTLEVQFLRRGVVTELPPSSQGVWGMKPVGKYDGDYAAAALAWSQVGTGLDTLYSFDFSLVNATLDALFAVDGDPANDNASVLLMAELQWTTGTGHVHKSPTLTVTVANDINRGGETDPPPIVYAGGILVPAGGTTGQVLAKLSNTDFDVAWVDGGTVVDPDAPLTEDGEEITGDDDLPLTGQ